LQLFDLQRDKSLFIFFCAAMEGLLLHLGIHFNGDQGKIKKVLICFIEIAIV